jgi:predicted metal-dependent hydrolase
MKQANLYPDASAQIIHFDEVAVNFVLKRNPKRRFIGLRVDQHGLTVTAPIRSTEHFIRRTLADNAEWILKKLKAWAKYRQPSIEWCDGETVPYLGNALRLNVIIDRRAKLGIALDLTGLVVSSKHELGAAAIKDMVIDWYRAEAWRHLPARLNFLAERARLTTPRFFLTNADGRWGSCNANGDVRLNWRLMKAPPTVIDYVAAHELAHLKHMDHSAAFWRTVAMIYPDFEAPRKELQRNDVFYRFF